MILARVGLHFVLINAIIGFFNFRNRRRLSKIHTKQYYLGLLTYHQRVRFENAAKFIL
jgi:hypothetical protein